MSRKNFYLSTAAGIAGMLLSGSAGAAVISYSFSNPITNLPTDQSTTFLLQKFNTSLGTLLSFSLTTTETMRASMTVTANTASTGVYATTEFTDSLLLPADGANNTGNYNLLADTIAKTVTFASLGSGVVTVAPIVTKTTHGVSVANAGPGTGTVTDSTLLADFTGSGNIGLTYSTITSTGIQWTGGNAGANQSSFIDVTGTITYTYTPAPEGPPPPVGVPEPMTAAVLMAGLAGLAGIRRRR